MSEEYKQWEKFGMRISVYCLGDPHYLELCIACHQAVAVYLEEHPELIPGYRYYDILGLAAPYLLDEVNVWARKYAIAPHGRGDENRLDIRLI